MKDSSGGFGRKIVAILLVLVVLAILACVIYGAENSINDASASFYGGFIQLCFSSWPSNLSFDRHSWWFAIGVSSRIVLVFGSFAGIVAILESVLRQRRLPMKYAEVLALRDNTIRDFLNHQLPIPDEAKSKFAELFDKAVKAADDDLKTQLHDLFGKEADRILKRKHETEQATL